MSDLTTFVKGLAKEPEPYGDGKTLPLGQIVTGKRLVDLPTPKVVHLGGGHWVRVGHERPEDRAAVAAAILKVMLQ